ncbi:MAG: helix-turn-helix domain-containing protein [Steroidobacteraceae bacterium]
MSLALPAEVRDRIARLADRIRIARQRRGWTIAETAAKAAVNRNTLNALELGKPGIAISVYVTVLWILGLDRSLDAVADPDRDTHGKTLEAARRPARIRKRKSSKDEYDF